MSRCQLLLLVLALSFAAVAVGAHGGEALPDDPAELVSRLPTSQMVDLRPYRDVEGRLVELGDRAIPALEKELRPGIRFRELNTILRGGGSRRWAVVRVLASIPTPKSTDLLVRILSDPPDNYAMRSLALQALGKRHLSDEQVVAMLGNREPRVVLAGLEHAGKRMDAPAVRAAVERVLDPEAARAQFRNEHGASLANADSLWEVRLAAGRLLGKDMAPEMRARAKTLLGELEAEVRHPTKPDQPAMISYASAAEIKIGRCLFALAALGQPVREVVEREAQAARGDHAKTLDMALALLGDRGRVARVASHLTDSPSAMIRFCAVRTLRRLNDHSAIPALRKALRDPCRRQDGSCMRIGDGMVYPVRIVAADALIDLGEDPKQVRALMRNEK